MKVSTKKLCAAAICLVLGLLLPQLFHLVGGRASGSLFSPMHIPVFLAGLLLGGGWGCAVGILTPLLSFLFFGMPPVPILTFMVVELATYGLISGLCVKRLTLYPSLILAQICGRSVYALSLFVAGTLLQVAAAAPASVLTSVVTGLPGIALQLAVIPPLVHLLRRSKVVAIAE